MENNLEVFNFNGWELSVLIQENGDPLFLATSLANILEYRTASDAIRYLDSNLKVKHRITIGNQTRNVNFLTEEGLFVFLANSRSPKAREIISNIDKTLYLHKKAPLQTQFSISLRNQIRSFLLSLHTEERSVIKKFFAFKEEVIISGANRRVDFYFPKLNIIVEYDEKHHNWILGKDLIREMDLKEELNNPLIIRVKQGEEVEGLIEVISKVYNRSILKTTQDGK